MCFSNNYSSCYEPLSNECFSLGKVENEKNLRHISGRFVYNEQEYSVVAEAAMTRKGNTFEYTPHVEISAPKMKSIQLKGGMKYSGMKLVDANLILIGVSKEPIRAEGKYRVNPPNHLKKRIRTENHSYYQITP